MHLLDKSRPYGIIYGDPVARYEQDGRRFSRYGEEVIEEKDEPLVMPAPPVQSFFKRKRGRPRKNP